MKNLKLNLTIEKITEIVSNAIKIVLSEDTTDNQLAYSIREYRPSVSEQWNYIKQYKNKIWQFLDNGYKAAGEDKYCGCDSPKSIVRNGVLIRIAFCNNVWVAISVYTGYRGGFKNVGITATTDELYRNVGKSAVQEMIRTDITQYDKFYWTECSGPIEHWYEKYGGIKIPNEYAYGMLMKPLTLSDDGFHFVRMLKGEQQEKIIFGFNDRKTYEEVYTKYTEYINSAINKIKSMKIDETVEKTAFGKLNDIQCAVGIINFFVDLRWEESCYDLPKESLMILNDSVTFLLSCDASKISDEITQQAIENGQELLRTMSVIQLHCL